MKFGWTTCLTYEAGKRKLGYDYFSNLLDEMKAHGMERLCVMMDNCHDPSIDPYNHGIAWPVRNPRLKSLVDPKAINARESSEFFSMIIEKAKKMGIEIYLEIKYWGIRGVEESYPGIVRETSDNRVCCDNDQAHNYMRDKMADLLERYSGLDGLVLEHPSYWGPCFCQSSRSKFRLEMGREISASTENEINARQNRRVAWAVADLLKLAKSIQKNIKFGYYAGFSPDDGNVEEYQYKRGQSVETLRNIGLDFVMPYCEGRHREEETEHIERVIEYLAPLQIYLHTTIRKQPPRGYPLPPKDPKYISHIINWAKTYAKKNLRLSGMSFFNEVNIPRENRDAVYETVMKEK